MPSLVETGLVILDILIKSPSPKDPLCQVWMEFALWFWRKRVLNFANIFSPFRNFFPLGNRQGPSFEQTWIPFTQGCFLPSLDGIFPVILEKKKKMWKVYDNDDADYDDDDNENDGQRTNCDQKSSLEPSIGLCTCNFFAVITIVISIKLTKKAFYCSYKYLHL